MSDERRLCVVKLHEQHGVEHTVKVRAESVHDCALLRRNFALDKVGGLLGLRRGGNQQPRIRLEPCNPRVEIGG